MDYYASLRSLYRQKRADAIRNGAPESRPQKLDFNMEDDSSMPAEASTPVPVSAPVKEAAPANPYDAIQTQPFQTQGTQTQSYLYQPPPSARSVQDEQRQMDNLVRQMQQRVQGLKS